MSLPGGQRLDRLASSSVTLSFVASSPAREQLLIHSSPSPTADASPSRGGTALDPDEHPASRETVSHVSSAVQIDRKAVYGLYCSWAMIGLVYGFVGNYINVPICQYVFGPMNHAGRTTTQQCNIAPTITCMPWNFQVFYGLFLDRVGFLGTRRSGWIIFGWTMSLACLGALCTVVQNLVDEGDFFTYMVYMMIMCFFYIFSTVSSDAMTIEFGKLEAPEKRGYILTTGQMVRFGCTVFVNMLGILGMNGSSYYPPEHDIPNDGVNSTIFPFELSFWQVHLVLLCATLPLYIAMVFLLKDPPSEVAEERLSLITVISMLWAITKTKVMACLIIFGIGSISIASLSNPAANILSYIVTPSTFQVSIGTFVGNMLFLLGVWTFRAFFMNRNWRVTFVWTAVLLTTQGLIQLMMVYNTWGIGQSGWFYAFGNNVLLLIQGVAQVLSSLSVMEIAPAGLEASIYEFLTSVHNSGITLNTNFQNILLPVFSLNGITNAYPGDPDEHADYNARMARATWFTMGANLLGSAIFCWFLPRDKGQCRVWLGKWRRPQIGIFNLALGGGVLFFSLVVSILSGLPSTDCLQIAGGQGCS